MNKDNDLKSVDSGNWFRTLITRSEKNTGLDLCKSLTKTVITGCHVEKNCLKAYIWDTCKEENILG